MGEGVDAKILHEKHHTKHQAFPLITVIIPVYNVAKVLERCVHSVLDQTYPNLEIILVDDGSTDMSGKFCEVFAKRYPRIRTLHQKNAGLSAARNAGLDLMRGEYVVFVDSDDTIEPKLIRALYDLAVTHETKLAISSFQEIFPDNRRQAFADPEICPPQTFDTLECLIAMLLEEGFTMSACSKLYHASLFKNVRFPVGKLYEDVGTTYRLILQCPRLPFTPNPYYNYYQNHDSIVHQAFRRAKLDLITLTDQMCDEVVEHYKSLDLSPAKRQKLDFVLKKRRMHARFSILRQMVMTDPRAYSPEDFLAQTGFTKPEFRQTKRQVVRFLRRHRADVLQNPYSSRRDILAMRTLLLGTPVFKFAWKTYAKRHK